MITRIVTKGDLILFSSHLYLCPILANFKQSITKNIEEKQHSPIDLKFRVEYVLLKAHIWLKAFSDTFLVYLKGLNSDVTHAKTVSTEQSSRREAYQTRLIWSLPCAYMLTRKFGCNAGKTSCCCG